jgi:acetyltransferase-like isoleucine patch superfamily enzyme
VTSHLSKRGVGFFLGDRSGLGDFFHIGGSGGVTIGNDVIVGSFVSFHSQEHVTMRTDVSIRSQGTKEAPIRIHDGCWLGARVTILAGSEVGEGSVVAAGAVVKGVFPPYSIVAGIPARVVRSR